jgi:hypothetical protein
MLKLCPSVTAVLVDVWRKISSKAIYLISLKLYMNNHWIVPYIFFTSIENPRWTPPYGKFDTWPYGGYFKTFLIWNLLSPFGSKGGGHLGLLKCFKGPYNDKYIYSLEYVHLWFLSVYFIFFSSFSHLILYKIWSYGSHIAVPTRVVW